MLKSIPSPRNSNGRPKPKTTCRHATLSGKEEAKEDTRLKHSTEMFFIKNQSNQQSNQPQHPQLIRLGCFGVGLNKVGIGFVVVRPSL